MHHYVYAEAIWAQQKHAFEVYNCTFYTCSVEMPAACSSMQWVAAHTTLWCPAVTTSTATEAAHGLQSKVAQSEL